jgi:hypothetical protein
VVSHGPCAVCVWVCAARPAETYICGDASRNVQPEDRVGLNEDRQRAEKTIADLYEAIEAPGDEASPDAVLAAQAAAANLVAVILVSDAVDRGTQALRQFTQSLLHDIVPALGRTLGER